MILVGGSQFYDACNVVIDLACRKITEVIRPWYSYLNATEEAQALADERLALCDTCVHKHQISPAGQAVITTINVSSSIYRCEDCSYPLASKVFSEKPCSRWIR